MATTDSNAKYTINDVTLHATEPVVDVVPTTEAELAFGWQERLRQELYTLISKVPGQGQEMYFSLATHGRGVTVSGTVVAFKEGKEVKTSLLSLIKKAAKAALVAPPELDFDVREVALDSGATRTTVYYRGEVNLNKVEMPAMPKGVTVQFACDNKGVVMTTTNPLYGLHDDTVELVKKALQRASVPA